MLYTSPFLDLLKGLPDDYLVCEEGRNQLTVKQLKNRSEQLAMHLSKKGVKRGYKVFLAVSPGIEFLVVFMALLHLRTITALVDPHMGNALYKSKIKQFKPKFAFIDSRLLFLQEHPLLRWLYLKLKPEGFYIPGSKGYTTFKTGPKLPLMNSYEKLEYSCQEEVRYEDAGEDEPSIVVYTSGTITEPKAVMHNFGSLYSSLEGLGTLINKNKDGRLATHLPHFAMIGLFTGFRTLFWEENWKPSKKIDFIKKYGITTLFGPPAEYTPLMDYCKARGQNLPDSLKHLFFGSAPVVQSFLKEIRPLTNAEFTCFYGMTENLVIASVGGDEKLANDQEGDMLGKTFDKLSFRISEEKELLIKGDYLFSHYYGKKHKEEWFPTGDLVREDEAGNLYMIGRKKNMIIRGHKNIYPGLYENTIMEIRGVKSALLMGVYDEKQFDEQVVLVAEVAEWLTKKELKKALCSGKHSIDSDVFPDHIVFMDIPRKGRQQKVDYEKLKTELKSKLLINS